MVYTSSSLALAAVETFVHLEPSLLPDDLVSVDCELPDELAVEQIEPRSLPGNWHIANNESLRAFGDRWLRSGKTLALRVPSAAIRGEWNVLLNPAHSDFRKIIIHHPQRFEFDLRMFRAQ